MRFEHFDYTGIKNLCLIMFTLLLFCLFLDCYEEKNLDFLEYMKINDQMWCTIKYFVLYTGIKYLTFYLLPNIITILCFEIAIYTYCFKIKNGFYSVLLGLLNFINSLKLLSIYLEKKHYKFRNIFDINNLTFFSTQKKEKPKQTSGNNSDKTEKNKKPLKIISFCTYLCFLITPTLIFTDIYIPTTYGELSIFYRIVSITFTFGMFIFFGILFILVFNIYYLPYLFKVNVENIISDFTLLLKLSLFSVTCWMLFFLSLFVFFFNFLGYVTYYDRINYNDWWNCTSVREFWTRWNLQVHSYIKKYLYSRFKKPVIYQKFLIFVISAFFHEYIAVLMFKKPFFIVFLCMLSQGLIIYLESLGVFGDSNVFFWVLFCFIGQTSTGLSLKYIYYRNISKLQQNI